MNDIKKFFLDYLDALATDPEPAIKDAAGESRSLRDLLSLVSQINDELPAECCELLTIPEGSTYRAAARKLAAGPHRPAEFFVSRAVQCGHCRGRGVRTNPKWLKIQEYRAAGRSDHYVYTRTNIHAPDEPATIRCDRCSGHGYTDFQPVTLVEALLQLGALGED